MPVRHPAKRGAAHILADETIEGNWTFDGTVTFNAAATFGADIVITDADPRLVLHETGVSANEGRWELIANGEELHLRALNDADAGAKDILAATSRTGSAIGAINYGNATDKPTHTLNGAAVIKAGIANVLQLWGADTDADCYHSYHDSAGNRKGYVGYAATTNDDFYILNEETGTARMFLVTSVQDATGGEIALQPGGQNALRCYDHASGIAMAFFGSAPILKPTVTGSRGGNAALASLCTALANLGLITNSTT